MARRFRQAHISWNCAFKHFIAEKAAQIGGNLLRESGSIVVHREQYSFDLKGWVERPPDAHKRIEKLRYSIDGQKLTLYWYEDILAGC